MTGRSSKMFLGITTFAVFLGITGATLLTQARADGEGYNWRAYDNATRTSPGGWMSYRQDAEQNACAQKKAYPFHIVSIQRVHIDQSWNQAQTIVSDYRC